MLWGFSKKNGKSSANLRKEERDASRPQLSQHTLLNNYASLVEKVISPGTTIEGQLSFNTPIIIEGNLKGSLLSTAKVVIAHTSSVEGEISANSLVIEGKAKGDILVKDTVEILSTGECEGNLRCKKLFVQEKALLNGKCQIG